MSLSFERKIAGAFFIALAVLVAIGATTWISLVRFERAFTLVEHTHVVLNRLEQIQVQALNVQTGSRGFALSGDPALLAPFEEGVVNIREAIAAARRMVGDNPAQEARLAQLEPLVEREIALMARRNEARRLHGLAPALDLEPLREGKVLMDEIRRLILEMENAENALLAARAQSAQRNAARTRALLLLAVATSLAFAAFAGTRIQRDLRARREADAALQRSRTLFETFFEQSTDAIVVVDTHGIIRRVNRRAEALFDYPRAELIGQPVEVLMPQRFHDRHVAHVKGYHSAPKFRAMGAGLELYARRKDGGEFPVDIMLSPLETDEGRVVLAAIRDITERQAAAAALKRHSAELEQANRDLEAFSYSVSHDLRAPLRHLSGFSAMLAEKEGERLDPESRRFLGIIENSARKMGELIDGLLDFARLGRAPLRRMHVDTAALVSSLVADGSIEAAPGTIWEVEPLPAVSADPTLLRQVWANLLANAAKYAARSIPPRIRVTSSRTHERGGRITFVVQDNGVGFDPRYAEKLFKVFSRLHGDREFSGTGIGLALVHRIVTRHGGRVWAESTPGQGATFFFSLPETPDPSHA